ncbi:peptide/nickel transport system substrate-binding protein/oligopeptide transport system substrate-binding protein [Thermosporothrix hazakensis]|jgi:peptide/nickel transport system substrate-binding protein/oligopeptide transport system substrate-binding protein|uniref:Peptide/nickel transport system substrate-binding protein/oligopeptide transport system substrate-binding protein n=1 Tax=Thermosporothrix hazakensis TaxID=644383 RepID=A0A326UAF5_THEHA|nr:peptide ABC transporter substrate-binding protein [Thermosporothrix hazakensis]PZW33061.1 peptide/nickel transport system substrate-binding protein/oligopeptide transport system substrate-binding protein [Thermosporothrix hazakensis]GCE49093.1 oligopeptide-binding protein OppA [Thermosporothrix hazakensis]
MREKHYSVRYTLPLLLSVCVLLLAACGGTNTNQSTGNEKAPDDKQIFVYPINNKDISTFDPAVAEDAAATSAVAMVFTGLVQIDEEQKLSKQLAESYNVASDGVTWTFKLKPNLKFNNGDPLTAEDVAYSIDRALAPATKSVTAPIYLDLIKGAKERNSGKRNTLLNYSLIPEKPDTLKIVLGKKAAYFLYTLSYVSSFVVNKKVIEKYGDHWMDHLDEGAGAGPFIVTKYIKGQYIEFVPNPHFYGEKPKVKKVIFPFYQNIDTIYRAYETNQVSWARVPSIKVSQAKQLPDGQFRAVPQSTVWYYTMNYLSKPFDNLKIRQAFALALDKKKYASAIWKDTVLPANYIVPTKIPGHNPDLTGPTGVQSTSGDPAKAKTLLEEGMKESGYTRATFPQITLTYASNVPKDAHDMIIASQEAWKSVLGIDVKLETVERVKLGDLVDQTYKNPKGLQMWFYGWGSDYPDPQNWISLLFHKDSTYNSYNYAQNDKMPNYQDQLETVKLMEKADEDTNQQERLKLYQQAEQRLVNDVAWIPMYQTTDPTVVKPCVKGYSPTAQGLPAPDHWSRIYISNESPCVDAAKYR